MLAIEMWAPFDPSETRRFCSLSCWCGIVQSTNNTSYFFFLETFLLYWKKSETLINCLSA